MTRNNALEWVYFYSCKFTLVLHTYMKQIWATWLGAMKSTLLLLGNDLSSFSFLMKMTDMAGIIHIAQRLTCAIFFCESINTMLSLLFGTESCYTIRKMIIRKIILPRQVTILPTWSTILQQKLKKIYFALKFFSQRKLRKAYLTFSCQAKKNLNCKGCIYHSAINAIANPFVYGRLKIQSSIQGLVEHLRWSFLQKYLMKKSL